MLLITPVPALAFDLRDLISGGLVLVGGYRLWCTALHFNILRYDKQPRTLDWVAAIIDAVIAVAFIAAGVMFYFRVFP